jgi:PAS domain S-box-containing protein
MAGIPNLHGETLANFAERSPDAMLALDPQGRILWLNAQTERIFGYPRHELIGRLIEWRLRWACRERFRGARHRRPG